MKVLSVINIKGGVGKTTTSINLAAGLAQANQRVLLIDLDGQANSTNILTDQEIDTSSITIVECIKEPQEVKKAIIKTKHGFDLIPSRIDLFIIETSLLLDIRASQQNRLYKMIEQVKEDYDIVIVDCNPSLGIMTTNAIYACKNSQGKVLIPIKIDKGATDGFKTTVSFIDDMNDKYDMDVDYQILITMKNRNNIDKRLAEELGQIAPRKVFETSIRNQSKPITQAGYEQTLVIDNQKAGVAEDYRNLIHEVLGQIAPRKEVR